MACLSKYPEELANSPTEIVLRKVGTAKPAALKLVFLPARSIRRARPERGLDIA
jgi:hypothetical protein